MKKKESSIRHVWQMMKMRVILMISSKKLKKVDHKLCNKGKDILRRCQNAAGYGLFNMPFWLKSIAIFFRLLLFCCNFAHSKL